SWIALPPGIRIRSRYAACAGSWTWLMRARCRRARRRTRCGSVAARKRGHANESIASVTYGLTYGGTDVSRDSWRDSPPSRRHTASGFASAVAGAVPYGSDRPATARRFVTSDSAQRTPVLHRVLDGRQRPAPTHDRRSGHPAPRRVEQRVHDNPAAGEATGAADHR